jgi:hypothetical protein
VEPTEREADVPFLIYQVPYLGNGMTIGINAVVHVLISHGVAIGLIGMIALAEYLGGRTGWPGWHEQAERMLKPAVIVITGVGAVTGVGIWFTASALNPRGIGSLLRVFFWPWFLEWFVFALEVGVLLYYYFNWSRWTGALSRRRWTFGAAYVALASFSAVLITGILGFMLTPDRWPWNRTFLSAFFNASFLPQLGLRLGVSFTLGALLATAFLLFGRSGAGVRSRVLGVYGRVLMVAAGSSAAFAAWYMTIVPSRFKSHAIFSVLTSHASQHPWIFWAANVAGLILLAATVAAGLARARLPAKFLVIPALVVTAAFVAEFERIREFIRGPYVMPGYMYSNQVLLTEEDYFRENGLLANSPWVELSGAKGDRTVEAVTLFKQNCSTCHTIGGINDIVDRVRGRSLDGIEVILGRTRQMVPFMAPFSGTDAERKELASFLFDLANGKLAPRPYARPFPPKRRKGS